MVNCFVIALFGLAHSHRGRQGVVKAGSMGLVTALCYVYSGSLWVVIFLHSIGDMYSGLLGWFGFGEGEDESVSANPVNGTLCQYLNRPME